MTLVMQLSKLQICMMLSHALYNFSYAVDLKHDVRNGLTRRIALGIALPRRILTPYGSCRPP